MRNTNLNLSGLHVSSAALVRPFPGCTGLTLHLLCQYVCMSLSPQKRPDSPRQACWLAQKQKYNTSMCIPHMDTSSFNLSLLYYKCLWCTPAKPLDAAHFHSQHIPLPPFAAQCGINHGDTHKKKNCNQTVTARFLPVPSCASMYVWVRVWIYWWGVSKLDTKQQQRCKEIFSQKVSQNLYYGISKMKVDIVSKTDIIRCYNTWQSHVLADSVQLMRLKHIQVKSHRIKAMLPIGSWLSTCDAYVVLSCILRRHTELQWADRGPTGTQRQALR